MTRMTIKVLVLVLTVTTAALASNGYSNGHFGNYDIGAYSPPSYYNNNGRSRGVNSHSGYSNNQYTYNEPSYGYQQQSYGYQPQSYSYQQPSYGYQPQQSYSYQQQSYGYQQPSYATQDRNVGYQQPSYATHDRNVGYQQPRHGFSHRNFGKQSSYSVSEPSYHQHESSYEPTKVITKKVYVPVVIRKKKDKKKKTISSYHGFYIPGGTQMFGKFKDLKSCQKACEITPTCFAGDYNPWVKKCYLHTNTTACSQMRAHKSTKHFKKIPCQVVGTTRGLITPGAQLFNGIQQKGIKSLSDCLKKCSTAGGGVAPNPATIATTPQLCFGVDYDFATHKCYFHVDRSICPTTAAVTTPTNLVANPTVVNIVICPLAEA